MEPKTRKALSWSLSVLVHVALLFLIIRAGIQYALPEGEVVSGQSIDVVENQTPGAQVQAAAANREAPASATHKAPAPKSPTTDADDSGTVSAPADPQPHFIPDKEPQDVVPEDKAQENTQDENQPEGEAQAEPATKPETTETSDDQKAPEVPVAQEEEKPEPTAPQTLPGKKETAEESQDQNPEEMKSVQTVSQANNAAAQGTPAQAAPNQGQTQPQQVAGNADKGAGASPDGPMLDETKLTEMPGNEKPGYPWIAKLRRQEGTVILRAFIRKDGHVDLPLLAQSSGFSTLDQECIRAYSHWKYKPGLSGWVLKPFRFILKK